MIQRIQTLFMLISIIITAVMPTVFFLWKDTSGTEVFFYTSIIYMILFGAISLMTLLSIFNYKKRQNQFVLNRLSIILNFILLGFFVYQSLSLSGETQVSEKGIGVYLPAISIVLLVLANRYIKKDEDLVKSVDRLR